MSFFSKNEVFAIAVASLMIGYLLAFKQFSWISWLSFTGIGALIVLVHHLGQKISAYSLDCSTETELWSMKRFMWFFGGKFKKSFPTWLFVPLIIVWLSFGAIKWLAVTSFNIIPLPSRIKFRWRELTEWHIALIATGGLLFNILAAIIARAFGFNTFALYNLTFVLFNLIPIGGLDGSKIFFGSILLWVFMVAFSLILLLLIQAASMPFIIITSIVLAIFTVVIFYYFYEAS